MYVLGYVHREKFSSSSSPTSLSSGSTWVERMKDKVMSNVQCQQHFAGIAIVVVFGWGCGCSCRGGLDDSGGMLLKHCMITTSVKIGSVWSACYVCLHSRTIGHLITFSIETLSWGSFL